MSISTSNTAMNSHHFHGSVVPKKSSNKGSIAGGAGSMVLTLSAFGSMFGLMVLFQVKSKQMHKRSLVKRHWQEWLQMRRDIYFYGRYKLPNLAWKAFQNSLMGGWLMDYYYTAMNQPPALPALPHHSNDTERMEALESWIRHVSTLTNGFVGKMGTATNNIRREYLVSKQQLEERIRLLQDEIRQRDRQNDRQIQQMLQRIQPWVDTVRKMLEDAQKQIDTLKRNYQWTRKNKDNEDSPLPPPPIELCCPITWDLMKDPVIAAADGHTYERSAIENVFQRTPPGQNPRSPKTNNEMMTRQLIPNVAIRSLCRDYEDSLTQHNKKNTVDETPVIRNTEKRVVTAQPRVVVASNNNNDSESVTTGSSGGGGGGRRVVAPTSGSTASSSPRNPTVTVRRNY